MRRTQGLAVGVPAAAVLGLVVAAAIGLPGSDAACVAEAACDCEALGPGPIRQSANAWSALTLVGAGLWVVGTAVGRRAGWDRALGTAVVASGSAAFAAHASVTAWAYRLDGAAIVALMALLTVHEWRPATHPAAALGAGAALAVAAAAIGAPGTNAVSVLLGASVVAAQPARGNHRDLEWAIGAGALLAGGALIRALADSGGPWCAPESLLQGHAAWHLVAAAATLLLVRYLRSEPAGD